MTNFTGIDSYFFYLNDGNIQNVRCPLGGSGPSPPGSMSDFFVQPLDFSDETLLS